MSVEEEFDEQANLNHFYLSVKEALDPNMEYVIGDLHANPLLMQYFFQRQGIAAFSKKMSEI